MCNAFSEVRVVVPKPNDHVSCRVPGSAGVAHRLRRSTQNPKNFEQYQVANSLYLVNNAPVDLRAYTDYQNASDT